MNRLKDIFLLLPVAACYAFIGFKNPDLAPQLPLFLAFFLGFVALPALGFGGLLVRLPLSLAERLALGSPAALASLFGLAWSGAALHQPLAVWAQPALGLAACLASLCPWGGGDKSGPKSGRCPATSWGDLLLMLAVLAAGLALFVPKILTASLPDPNMAVDYYMDDTAQTACSFAALRAMEHGLPIIQPYLAGTRLVYHVLYHFDYAVCTFITGIHPLDQMQFLWPPVLWLFMATALVAGLRRLAGFTPLETAVAAVLLLFTGGYGFYATPSTQLFSFQHTFFMGLPAATLFAAAMYGHLSGRGPRLQATHAGTCLLTAMATKAMLVVLLPVSLLPVFLLRLVKRQIRWPEVLLACQAVVVVGLLHLTIYQNTARVTLRLPKLGSLLLGSLDNFFSMLLVLGPYVLLVAFAAESNIVLRRKLGRAGQFTLFCLGYVLVSSVLLKMFNFVGGDFYFYWHARVLVFIAVAPALAHMLAWRTPRFAAAAALMLILGVLVMLQSHLLPRLFAEETSWQPAQVSAKLMDRGEREALRWASENLDRRKVFFTNKATFLGSYLGGYISIDNYDTLGLSGLQGHAWATGGLSEEERTIAGERIGRQQAFLKAATTEDRAKALANLDVDYYFHCIRIAPPGFEPPACLREVHRTDSFVIYENGCRAAPVGQNAAAKE